MKPEEAAFRVMLEATALLDQCGELVIVGGWVPEIHFPKQSHIGSIDVDVVLNPATFDEAKSLHDRLVQAGYSRSEENSPTQYRRSIEGHDADVKLDLLTTPVYQGKKVQELVVGGLTVSSLPGLDLALMCNHEVQLPCCSALAETMARSTSVAKLAEPIQCSRMLSDLG